MEPPGSEREIEAEVGGLDSGEAEELGPLQGGEPSPGPDSLLEETARGTGPWEGTWILADKAPTIADAEMYFHNDLDSTGGPEYLVTEEDDCWLDPGDEVSVYGFNESCGEPYKRALATFKDSVVSHENRHETSLNECIWAVNTDGRLAAIEAIVSTKGEGDAKEQAERLWTDGLVGKLLDAKRTAQGPDTAYIYHWREHGEWRYGAVTKSHNGTEGCPK